MTDMAMHQDMSEPRTLSQAAVQASLPASRRSLGRRISSLFARGCFGGVVLAGAFLLGLSGFAASVRDLSQAPEPRAADAIVVLTGGSQRISEALEMLQSGKGRRLLISGVNEGVTAGTLAGVSAVDMDTFACCVDLDYRARNTVGNAFEIRRWAAERGYRSLIVVTSAYHMPRTLTEITAAAPDLAVSARPVATPGLDLRRWWADRETARLLAGEYLKYMVSALRVRLGFTASASSAR